MRLALFQRLLARDDERAMRGKRGHRLTQRGSRNRFIQTWFWSMRVWGEHEIARREGAHDSWIPAAVERGVANGRMRHAIRSVPR